MTWRDPAEALYETWRQQMLDDGYAGHTYTPSQAWGGAKQKPCIVEEDLNIRALAGPERKGVDNDDRLTVKKPCSYEISKHDPRLPADGWAALTTAQRSAFIDLADAALEAAMGSAAVG